MQKHCGSCNCIKTDASFSKAQWKKSQGWCKLCMERKPTFEEFGQRTVSFLKTQQDEGVLPIRKVEAVPLPLSQEGYRCDFCGLDALQARQVKKFGPNIVCTLCKNRCEDLNIPLDLSREEALRVNAAKQREIFNDMTKGATTIGEFVLAFNLLTAIERDSVEEMQKMQKNLNAKDRKWFNNH